MKTKIQLVNKENREDILSWEDFLLRANDGNILQSTLMANVFERAGFDWNLIVARRSKEIVGGALSTIWPGKKKFKSLARFSTFKTTYGPIVLEKEKGIVVEIVKKIEEYATKNKAMQQILITNYGWMKEEINALKYERNPREVGCTFLIDLRRPEEELWRALGKTACRKTIRKAEKNGVEVKEDSTQNAPQVMYNLHLKWAKRLGIPSNPLSFFKGIWECLAKRKHAIFFFAYYQGKPIAGSIVLAYKKTIYAYSTASMEEALKLNPSKLLKWHVIRWGKEHGYDFFDLLFAPSGHDQKNPLWGIYFFKKNFGGIEIPVYYYVKKYSPVKLRLWYQIILPTYNRLTPISRFF